MRRSQTIAVRSFSQKSNNSLLHRATSTCRREDTGISPWTRSILLDSGKFVCRSDQNEPVPEHNRLGIRVTLFNFDCLAQTIHRWIQRGLKDDNSLRPASSLFNKEEPCLNNPEKHLLISRHKASPLIPLSREEERKYHHHSTHASTHFFILSEKATEFTIAFSS